jgi:uncharacterized protein
MGVRRHNYLKKMTPLDRASLGVIGASALNWGLVGLLNFDLVRACFGTGSKTTRSVYGLMGVGGIYAAARAAQLSNGNHRFQKSLKRAKRLL